ncbi:MAG TPA: FG-GAP-like repeat-containing protein [bacterium]|nr:FG-GAP-like repeat-containing protein [bacterium]
MRPTSFLTSRAMIYTAFVFAAAAIASPVAAAPIAFESHVEYAVASNPLHMAAADFQGDGLVDLAVTKTDSFSEPNQISLLRNAGGGAFLAATFLPATEVPRCLDAGDIDGDGDQDIIIGYQSGEHRAGILHNDGFGNFGSAQLLAPVEGRADEVKAIDLDGDEDLDLVLMQAGGEEIVVLENEGSGSFAPPATYGGISSAYFGHLAAGDIDADNDPDLVVGRSLAVDTQSIYRNNGDGTFAAPEPISTPFSYAGNDLGDVDGDHDLDLALLNESGPSLLLFLNNGAGQFTSAGSFFAGGETQVGSELTLADLDQDGLADAMFSAANTPRIATLRSNGSGFEAATFHALGGLSRLVEACDLDGDHDADVVATLFETDRVSVLLNEAASPTAVTPGATLLHRLAFGPAMPNPMRVSTAIPLVLPDASHVRISIIDVSGRLVRALFAGAHAEGRSVLDWDRRDASGNLVRAGVYFARLETPQTQRTVRIAVLD